MRRIVLTTLLVSSVAHANPQSDQLFEEGRKLLDAGDNQGACDKFEKAIELDNEAAGTMLNLGICNENLHKYATALYWFRRAGNYAGEGGAKPYQAKANEHSAVVAGKVANTSITFATPEPPAGTRVTLDHKLIERQDYAKVDVDPGHHVIEASAPGMKNFHKEIDVEDKPGPMAEPVKVEFVAGSNAIVIDRGKTRRKIAIGTAIGGAVVMGVAIGFGYYERSQYCVIVSGGPCDGPSGPNGSPMLRPKYMTPAYASEANNDYMFNAKWYGTGIFIAGAAMVGAAAVIYFTAPQPEKIDQTVFVPTLDRNGAGFALTGRF